MFLPSSIVHPNHYLDSCSLKGAMARLSWPCCCTIPTPPIPRQFRFNLLALLPIISLQTKRLLRLSSRLLTPPDTSKSPLQSLCQLAASRIAPPHIIFEILVAQNPASLLAWPSTISIYVTTTDATLTTACCRSEVSRRRGCRLHFEGVWCVCVWNNATVGFVVFFEGFLDGVRGLAFPFEVFW